MELVLNDEQRLLRESAEKLVERAGGPDAYRAVRETADGFDSARQRTAAEAGWLSLMVPERSDGLGLGMTELALVLEQAGRGLMPEPIGATAIAAYAIGAGHAATGAAEILEKLTSGETIIVPAVQDPATPEGSREQMSAMPFHYGYQLTGRRIGVPFAASAESFLVDAQTADGTVLIVMPRDAHGVSVKAVGTVDGGTHGIVEFLESPMMSDDWLIAGVRQGVRLTAAIYDRLLIATSAEMLGVMDQALALAVAYLKTREQFGRPIGSFQALQHRAVNEYIEIELTRSLLYQVCQAFDAGRGSRAMAAAVKARASDAVLSVVRSVIQMHGAIGFTDEYDAGLYLRRAMTLAARYGNAAHHRRRYAGLAAADEAKAKEAPVRRRRKKRPKSIFAKQR